jgi:hypothetical protein
MPISLATQEDECEVDLELATRQCDLEGALPRRSIEFGSGWIRVEGLSIFDLQKGTQKTKHTKNTINKSQQPRNLMSNPRMNACRLGRASQLFL